MYPVTPPEKYLNLSDMLNENITGHYTLWQNNQPENIVSSSQEKNNPRIRQIQMGMRALVIDDEYNARLLLKTLLASHDDIVEVREADSGAAALQILEDYKPDILFLDIHMPKMSGFDLLDEIKNWQFEIIYTTAFDQYAIKAIRYNALDYLLKPIDEDELAHAIARCKERITAKAKIDQHRQMLRNLKDKTEQPELAVNTHQGVFFMDVRNITYLEADNNYTHIHEAGGRRIMASRTLKEYDELLSEAGFVRVHKSFLVNKKFMKHLHQEGNLELTDGTEIPVSRRRKQYLLEMLGKK